MPADLDLEEELLRRFQALKSVPSASPSFKNVSDQQAKKAAEEDEELERIADGRFPPRPGAGRAEGSVKRGQDDEFRRRMASLRGAELEHEEEVDDGGDDEVNAFIASLSAPGASTAQRAESASEVLRDTKPTSSQGRALEKEAKDALAATSGYLDNEDDATEHKEADEENAEDFETEDEILLRALEEAELEVDQDIKSGKLRSGDEEDGVADENETEQDIIARAKALSLDPPRDQASSSKTAPPDSPTLSFPSLPSHLPTEAEEEDFDAEAQARMNMLLGLSEPSTRPGPPRLPTPPKDVGTNRKPGQGWNLPGYKDDMDDDPDSWCCICNKDAEVVCLGCEGDPYCEECWQEGHVGERHRTKRVAGKGGRKAVGA